MGLKKVPYEKLYDIVSTVMRGHGPDINEERIFFIVGQWYYDWTLNDLPKLSLKVPVYKKELIKPFIDYLYWLDLILKLFRYEPSDDLNGFSLFDIRGYRYSDSYYQRNKSFASEYLNSRAEAHFFEGGRLVSADRFLPLFPTEQIGGHKSSIADAFYLFEVIGKTNIIPHTLALDLEKNLTLIITEANLNSRSIAFGRFMDTDSIDNDDDLRDKVLDELVEKDIKTCLILTYPYHVNVNSAIVNEFRGRSRIFALELSNRFCHEEISEDQLVLTNAEAKAANSLNIIDVIHIYRVIKTNCNTHLVEALQQLRNDWHRAKFNIFTTPFPAKWFMCIHTGLELSFWEDRFKKDFYEVTGQLLTDALNALSLIYKLDWIGNYLPRNKEATLLMPKTLMFQEVTSALKNHLIHSFKRVGYSEEIGTLSKADSPILIIDAFNIILMNNIPAYQNVGKVRILAPDFLYYTYQPFVQYTGLKYHFEALIGGARILLDKQQPEFLEQWNLQGEELLEKSRKALRDFNTSKVITIEQDKRDEPLDKMELVSDLSRSEMLEHVLREERRSARRKLPTYLEITTATNRKIVLRPTSPVLIKKNGYLIRSIAAVLDDRSLFIPMDEIIKNLDIKNMVDRLITLSPGARFWHQRLRTLSQSEAGLYDGMASDGLSISKFTFEKDYLQADTSSSELHLPRSKNDWKIVCDRLGIEDRHTAWNAIKCRDDINRLRLAYSRIIEIMVDTGSFGINVNDQVIEQIASILSELPESNLAESEKKKDSIALITEISEKINLEQIEQITT